jgi:hypothetical protein
MAIGYGSDECRWVIPARLETDAATAEHIVRSNALWPMISACLPKEAPTSSLSSSSSSEQSPLAPHLVITSSIAEIGSSLIGRLRRQQVCHSLFSSLACERPDLRIDLLCPGPSTPISSQQQ